MKRVFASVALLAVLLHLLTGCWDRIEVNDVAYVNTATLDLTPEGRVRLAIQLVVPAASPGPGGSGGAGRQPPYVMAGEGDTVGSALRSVQEAVPRRLFWGHMQAVVLGEDLARQGIGPYLSFFARQREPRGRVTMLICRGEAGRIWASRPALEATLGEVLREMPTFVGTIPANLSDVLTTLNDQGIDPAMPAIDVVEAAAAVPEAPSELQIRAIGVAALQQDRLVGFLGRDAARVVMWIRGRQLRPTPHLLQVPLPSGNGRKPLATVELRYEDMDVRPTTEQGRLAVDVLTYGEGVIVETMAPIDLAKPEVIRQMEHNTAQTLVRQLADTLEQAQSLRSDVFGFGRAIHRTQPARWSTMKRNWRERFPDLVVRYHASIRISGGGKTNKAAVFPPAEYRRQEKGGGGGP